MRLHPIMYVDDQYAERDFYVRFGFTTRYEGDEFPGFLAIQHGETIIGLQRASDAHPPYREGLRWQFEIDAAEDLDAIVRVCVDHGLQHEVITEAGGDRFQTRIAKVRTPAGHTVWFEGPNERKT